MNLRMQRLCVWCGPGLILIFMIGFLFVAGLVPPPSPNLGASEVARFYTEHQTRIQIGLIISMIGSGLAFPWAAVISVQMRRIEGRRSPLAAIQLTAGGVLCLLLVFPMFALSAAAYRPADRSPEITQALNDLGWLPLVGFVAPPVVQVIAIALAVFSDKSAEPVFPGGWATSACGARYCSRPASSSSSSTPDLSRGTASSPSGCPSPYWGPGSS